MLDFSPGLGELGGLGAALCWSISTIVWGFVPLSAVGINAAKNLFGALMLLLHVLVLAWVLEVEPFSASPESWGWLAASGLTGIVIGDTCFFRSLQLLRPRKALMVASSSPVFAALLMMFIQRTPIAPLAVLGILLVVAGVMMVVADRPRRGKHRQAPESLDRQTIATGLLLGLAGAFFQALGGMLSQRGMQDCGTVEASFIRIATSAVILGIWFRYRCVLKSNLRQIFQFKALRLILPATAMGTWLGIWLSQVAFKETSLAIAQTLLATSPLFAIPTAYFVLRERVHTWGYVGTVLGLLGIYLVVAE